MPRYFFDTKDGGLAVRDDEGHELPDAATVRRMAIEALSDLASDDMPEDGDRHVVFVRVRDERDHIVFHASLSLVADWIDEPDRPGRWG